VSLSPELARALENFQRALNEDEYELSPKELTELGTARLVSIRNVTWNEAGAYVIDTSKLVCRLTNLGRRELELISKAKVKA
jgi:hypothetical protein